MILQVAGAFIAIFAFSIVIGAPKKYLFYCGMVGAVGWFVYLQNAEEYGVVMASFIAAMVIALCSHIFARIFKAPVTVFLIPGILILVPGAGMYHTVYQLFLGDKEAAGGYLLQTMQIAGMIALAIFVMDSVFTTLQHRQRKRKLK